MRQEGILRHATARILGLVPTMLVLITIAFFLIRVAPGGPFDSEKILPPEILINLETQQMTQLVTVPLGARPEPPADERFEFRNWGIWFPPRKYLNEPRPVWNSDGSKILYTSEESGRMNLYVVDVSDL